jgi:hypothetical protein
METCLTALKRLNEAVALRPLDESDRRNVRELLWSCLRSDRSDVRKSALDMLVSVKDFGDLAGLLGQAGVDDLLGRIQATESDGHSEGADVLAAARGVLATAFPGAG